MSKTSYYNTTHSVHPDLGKFEQKAQGQEEQILDYFKGIHRGRSPSQVLAALFDASVPLTSVRRAMTNLTNAGELIKTNTQIRGPYGRPEYQWRRAYKYDQGELF